MALGRNTSACVAPDSAGEKPLAFTGDKGLIHHNAICNASWLRPDQFIGIGIFANVNGVLTSLEAARNYGVDRYVYISSGAVYGNVHYDVVDETIPLHAENPYGATKVACEELVRNYGLDSVSLRVGFVYGPGRVNECPVNMILSTLLKEGKVDWDHGSEQMLDFIYIEDCVEAIAKISLADHNPHAEYNIGGGEVIPYTRIIDKARKLFPTAPIHVGPGDLGYDNLGALSVQRAFEDFGWKPRFSIEQGMEQYMNWLKNF